MRTELPPIESARDRPVSPTPPQKTPSPGWLEGGMAMLDGSGRMTEINEPLSLWLEQPRASLVGQSFWETAWSRVPAWKEPLSEFRRSSTPFGRVDLKYAPAGSSSAQWFSLEAARNSQGGFIRLNSTLPPRSELEEASWDEHLQTETSRREMFMRLLRAEAQMHGLLQRWPCVVFSQRPDFSLPFASPNIEELTGVCLADWSAQPRRFWEVVHEQDAGELRQALKHAVQTRKDATNTYRIRHAITGRTAYILEHRQPVVSRGGLLLGYEVMWQDVTRQTVAENKLFSAAWKETLAVLTLGMAHDFRNIMAGIHSLSESFLSQLPEASPFKEGLSLIQQNSMQASQLVQRMINLHLGQPGERSYHDLNEIARDLVELMGKIVKRRITVKTELAAGQLPVYADLVELRQVVINLMLNAADAMPDGGALTLRTSQHEQFAPQANMKGTAPRLPCLCLAIADTGTGIKERHIASVFDPFFTTKTKGTGLGLYNARLAVEKHKGAISVESQEGAGTTFRMWLPRADFTESVQALAEAAQTRKDRLSLLLLGRSGELLDRTAEWLRSNNCHVVTATAPESVAELMPEDDPAFSGALVLAEPNDALPLSFLAEVRRQKQPLKVALKLAGCSQDDADSELLSGVDLVLGPDLPETGVLTELEELLK